MEPQSAPSPARAATATDSAFVPALTGPLAYLLVLPVSHVRFWDFSWQYAIYDVFHTRSPSRFSHALFMAPNVFSWILIATHLAGYALPFQFAGVPLHLDGGLALAAGLAGLYFWYDLAVGALLFPVLLAMWLGASAFVAHVGHGSLTYSVALAAAFGMLQALGHVPEPVPPPWSGTNGFVPFRAWLVNAPAKRIAGYFSMGLVGATLEWWAGPRLLPVQVMKVLSALGYRPSFRRVADRKTVLFGQDITYAVNNLVPATAEDSGSPR